jgi:hypothetical protein
MATYSDDQGTASGAIPVRLVNAAGSAFYTASGGGGGSSAPYVYTPLGYQQITSLGTAQSLTVPGTATVAFITVEGAAVRWRDDGTAPTASIGMPVGTGVQITYSGTLSAIQFIQQAASATLNISYFK